MQIKKYTNTILLLLCLSLMSIGLQAWSVSDAYLGNRIQSFDTRLMSMGNAGVYNEFRAMGLLLNPANVTINTGKHGIQTNAMFTRDSDDRSFPLYNTFDAYLDDATYSSNTNLYDEYGFAAFTLKQYGKMISGVGIHYTPIVNFESDYDEEVRNKNGSDNDTYPEIIAINKIKNEGQLNSLGLTLSQGYQIKDDMAIHLGLTIAQVSGDSKSDKSIRWTNFARTTVTTAVLPDSTFRYNSDISGMQIKLGTNLKVNERVGIGIAYSPKSEFDRDTKLFTMRDTVITNGQSKDKYILPSRLRIGFNYKPRNLMKTEFNADVEYVTWKDLGDLYDNAWDLHVGVEHSLENRIPIRLGFQSVTDWLANPDFNNLVNGKPTVELTKVITPSLTAGSSLALAKNVTLDLGISYSWREYEALDLFSDGEYSYPQLWTNAYVALPFTNRGWNNPDKVRESFTQLSTGITWTW